jgi:hypothetical protein
MGMNQFEATLSAALRTEAQEAAMSTETPQQYEVLSNRLDEVDAQRRRSRRGVLLIVAAAAVVVAAAMALGSSLTSPAVRDVPPASAVDQYGNVDISGHWTTLLTEAEAQRAVAGTPAAGDLAPVLEDLAEISGTTAAAGPWRLDLWISRNDATLYLEGPDGQAQLIDRFSASVVADELEAISDVRPAGVETSVYRVAAGDEVLTMTWVSGSATGTAEANEAAKRVLYTASPWERAA